MTFAWALSIAAITCPCAVAISVYLTVKSKAQIFIARRRAAVANARYSKSKIARLEQELENLRSRVNSIHAKIAR